MKIEKLIGKNSGKDDAMSFVVSHLDGVVASVSAEGTRIHRTAQERLNAHRDTGKAEVELTHGDVDAFVSLVDPNCLSIEFGHFMTRRRNGTRTTKKIPGLYIVTGAAGLI